MDDHELKKLKRSELLEMLLDRSKEVEHLRNYLEDANRRISEFELQIEQVGSVDEAIRRMSVVIDMANNVAEQARRAESNAQAVVERTNHIAEDAQLAVTRANEAAEEAHIAVEEANEAVMHASTAAEQAYTAVANANTTLLEANTATEQVKEIARQANTVVDEAGEIVRQVKTVTEQAEETQECLRNEMQQNPYRPVGRQWNPLKWIRR